MTALELRSENEDTLKARIHKADEFVVKSLGSECVNIQKFLQEHDLRTMTWQDLEDHDGGPIMTLKDWLAESTGLFDLGTNVAHREALHYIKREFFMFKQDDLEVACVTVFDVLDQEFKFFGFRKSAWLEFLGVK